MAFNKKNKRRIAVAGQEYFWAATGDDGWINLHVMTDMEGGQKLCCCFKYHHNETPFDSGVRLSNQFVITSYTVRQVIEYALQQGWTPLAKGPLLNLRYLDDKIDLRLSQNRADIIKASSRPNPAEGSAS